MTTNIVHSGDRLREVASTKVVALYSPETGAIVHMHTVVTFKGGREISEEQMVKAARQHAGRVGHDVDGLKVKVSSDPVHARRRHRIDPQTSEWVPVPGLDLTARQPSS